jgi:hypothetical protein
VSEVDAVSGVADLLVGAGVDEVSWVGGTDVEEISVVSTDNVESSVGAVVDPPSPLHPAKMTRKTRISDASFRIGDGLFCPGVNNLAAVKLTNS